MICFDLGNVIIECDVDKFYDQMKDYFSEEKYKQLIAMRDIIQTQHDLGIMTYRNFFEHFDASLSKENLNQILQLWDDAIQPNKEMVDMIYDFKKNHGKNSTAFLSNVGFEHSQKLLKTCPDLFQDSLIHFSYQVGARKPTKLYFQSFLNEVPKHIKSNHLFIDDREDNCMMAQNLGFLSFQFSLKDDLNNKIKMKKMQVLMERYV